MKSTVLNVITAQRMARRRQGVTVAQFAEEAGITRQAAHALLTQLVDLDELVVEGDYRGTYKTKRAKR